jgi:hypothetical protein
MEATAEQGELFSGIVEKAPRRGFLWRYLEATMEHGALVPAVYAAEALDVSRQRVYQLIDSGQLDVIEIGDRKFVPADSLEDLLKLERRQGVRVARRWIYTGQGEVLKKS